MLSGLLVMLIPLALAKIEFYPSVFPQFGTRTTAFAITEGCSGAPTTAVKVKIPPHFLMITPRELLGWKISLVTESIRPPFLLDSDPEVNLTVREINYTAEEPLPTSFYQSFSFSFYVGRRTTGTFEFPIEQVCGSKSIKWADSDVTGYDPEYPAPSLRIVNNFSPSESSSGRDRYIQYISDSVIIYGSLTLFFAFVSVVISSISLCCICMHRPSKKSDDVPSIPLS
jgi:uncharacterized protein YcnI